MNGYGYYRQDFNDKNDNEKLMWIAAAFVIAILISLLLSSCSTKKSITEDMSTKTEIRKDSSDINTIKRDSADTSRKTNVKESEKTETETKVEKSDSAVTTVDTQGNIIKQEIWHKEKETVSRNREYEKSLLDSIATFRHINDSLSRYVSRCDSLQEKLSHKEYITVEKQKIPKWCYYCLGFCILFIIFAIIKFVKWLRTTLQVRT